MADTQKVKEMAQETVDAVNAFMAALETLKSLERQRTKEGYDLTQFDADFAEISSISHVTGTKLNGVLNTAIPDIRTYINAEFYSDNLEKVRSGKR